MKPDKHPDTIVQALLRESFVTPKELFYVRNHGSIPQVDPSHYRLMVSGLIEQQLGLSSDEIRSEFPKKDVMAALHHR